MTRALFLSIAAAASLMVAGGASLAAPLPAGTQNVALGHRAQFGRLSVRPVAVVEDSRCPRYVSCVWRGRLVIKAALPGGKDVTLENGKPQKVAGGTLTLLGATPLSGHGETIPPQRYLFQLRFER